MLADQSILEKNLHESAEQLTKNNNNTLTSTVSTGSTNNNNNNIALNVNHATNTVTNSNLNLTTQNVPTIQRIGSIGRTTITCITPAGGDAMAAAAHPQAALAAAGVELDTVEDNNSLTEVVVKIENSATSSQDEDEEMPDEGDDAPTTETNDEDEEGDMTYDDIKLSSPMMWAIDSVKIEQEEEFEDILTAGLDNTTTTASLDNEDEFLQAMPIGTTMGSNLSLSDMDLQKNQLQDPQELLEKHQHFQKLRLQPNQPVQIKLRSIPATITSIQPKQASTATPPLAPLSTLKRGLAIQSSHCRERYEEENQTLLQQVQVQQPKLVHQTKSQTSI
ncbi:hypothetical protein DOY81_009746 [Sarcophaga bullata]|nr:hypothetical protein DOY81_009746 [Sarcophaga bullata]